MYKVFINDKPLYISSDNNLQLSKNILKLDYKSDKDIRLVLELLSTENKTAGAFIFSANEKLLWKKFCHHFKIIEAAGSLVFNKKKELLMIYRLDKWDLPKGKIEKNEKPAAAALREV